MNLFLPTYSATLTGNCLEENNIIFVNEKKIYINEIDPIKFPKDHHFICTVKMKIYLK
jgi:hypothetical protein